MSAGRSSCDRPERHGGTLGLLGARAPARRVGGRGGGGPPDRATRETDRGRVGRRSARGPGPVPRRREFGSPVSSAAGERLSVGEGSRPRNRTLHPVRPGRPGTARRPPLFPLHPVRVLPSSTSEGAGACRETTLARAVARGGPGSGRSSSASVPRPRSERSALSAPGPGPERGVRHEPEAPAGRSDFRGSDRRGRRHRRRFLGAESAACRLSRSGVSELEGEPPEAGRFELRGPCAKGYRAACRLLERDRARAPGLARTTDPGASGRRGRRVTMALWAGSLESATGARAEAGSRSFRTVDPPSGRAPAVSRSEPRPLPTRPTPETGRSPPPDARPRSPPSAGSGGRPRGGRRREAARRSGNAVVGRVDASGRRKRLQNKFL